MSISVAYGYIFSKQPNTLCISVLCKKLYIFNNSIIANYFNVHGKSQAELYNILQQNHLWLTRFQEENHIHIIRLQST